MYFAQINLLTRIVESTGMGPELPVGDHMIEITEEQYFVIIGHRHDEQTGEFIYVPPAPIRELKKIDYLRRFTQEERIAIRNFAKTNDVALDYIELMNVAETVTLDDPLVVNGLAAFEAAGKIGVGRAAEIRA